MPGTSAPEVIRRPFQGVLQIVRYNWPYYAFSIAGGVAVIVIANLLPLHSLIRTFAFLGAATDVFFVVSSLLVSWYVYDLSLLYRWDWVPGLLETRPQTWVNLHAGLDESSEAIRHLFPAAAGNSFDFYDASMTENSIERARKSAAVSESIAACGTILKYPARFGI